MIVSIGSVTLDNELVWVDEFDFAPVIASAERTVGGRLVIQERSLQGARPITLQGDEDRGWQKRSTIEALKNMAGITGATYTLIYGTFTTIVRFRHEEGNPVQFAPVKDYLPDPGTDEWYYGKILLQEV